MAFKDTWSLSDVDVQEYNFLKLSNNGGKALYSAIEAARYTHSKSMFSNLVMMAVRIIEMKRL